MLNIGRWVYALFTDSMIEVKIGETLTDVRCARAGTERMIIAVR